MKTTKILVALALTLTAGIAAPFNGYVTNNRMTASAEEDEAKAVNNYAHNYDYIGLDFNNRGFIGSRDLLTPKTNSFDDRICVFSIVNVTEDGNEYCNDYFVSKEAYEEEGFEILATYGSNNESSKYFILRWRSSKSPINGFLNYETKLVHTDKGFEKFGPRIKDWRDETRAFIGENEVLYCNKDNMPIHFYSLSGNRNWLWSYRGPDKEIGTLNKDGSITLYDNVMRLGNVNHDNVIDIEDVTIIQNHINGVKALDDKAIWAADVNGDGVVDIEDVVAIMNQINGVSSFEKDDDSENYRILEEAPKTVTKPAATTTTTTTTTNTTTTAAKTIDNYAHNFDHLAWNVGTVDKPIDSILLQSKENDYKDKVCVFSTVGANSNSVTCTDHFYDKKYYEDDSFELFATVWGYSDHYRVFAKTDKDYNIGKIKYATSVVYKTENEKEIIGPNEVDFSGNATSFVYLSKNMKLYCNKDTKIYYYTSYNDYYEEWFREICDKVGYFNSDGSITLLDNVVRLGDVNHDNVIDVEDGVIIQNHINGVKPLDDKYMWSADVNGDGTVDIEDVTDIMNQINGVSSFENKHENENYRVLTETLNVTTTTTKSASKTAMLTTTTTAAKLTVTKPCDVNCDNNVDMSDVVLIMQALANPDKYGINGSDEKHITEQGWINGDVDKSTNGITANDALKIQEYLLGKAK